MTSYPTTHLDSIKAQAKTASAQSSQLPRSTDLHITNYIQQHPLSSSQLALNSSHVSHNPIQMHPHRHHALTEPQWQYSSQHLKPTTQSTSIPIHSQSVPPIQSQHNHQVSDQNSHSTNPYHTSHLTDSHVDKSHQYAAAIGMIAAPPPPGVTPSAPTHAQYLYPIHHQLITPVAHVPIGAAHYAHLPPSIWNPPRPTAYPQQQIHSHPLAPNTITPAHPSHIQQHHPAATVHHLTTAPHPHSHPNAYQVSQPQSHPPLASQDVHPHLAYGISQIHPAVQTAIQTGTTAIHPELHTMTGHVSYATVPTAIVNSQQPQKVPDSNEPKYDSRGQGSTINYGEKLAVSIPPSSIPCTTQRDHITVPSNVHMSRPDNQLPNGSNSNHLNGDIMRNSSIEKSTTDTDIGKTTDNTNKSQPPRQSMRKPRKPYTITKTREVWTVEEHGRFVTALEMFNRDWKRIEAYIGSKTVLQIRSHAQKYFGKVAKNGTGAYIPPPRPKKRAQLPYPRSRNLSNGKTSPSASGSDNASGTDVGVCGGSKNRNNIRHVVGTTVKPSKSDAMQPTSSSPMTDSRLTVKSIFTNDSCEEHPRPASWSESHARDNRTDSYENKQQPQSNNSTQLEKSNKYSSHSIQQPSTDRQSIRSPQQEAKVQKRNDRKADTANISHDKNTRTFDDQLEKQQRTSNEKCIPNVDDNTDLPRLKPLSGIQKMSEQRDVHRNVVPIPHLPSPQEINRKVAGKEDSPRTNDNPRVNHPASHTSRHDPLVVLSNCVDMMSRGDDTQQQPRTNWNAAIANNRESVTRITSDRPTPSSDGRTSVANEHTLENVVKNQNNQESNRVEASKRSIQADQTKDPNSDSRAAPNVTSEEGTRRRRSISPDAGPSDGNESIPLDPQRSSSGSGNGSDDAIAGFSSSDRPSVSDMGASNGSGSSPNSSDLGDPDVEPKSSNDGSGDDGNRQSPSIRGSSPADPNSSGSRENTPNDNTDCGTVTPGQSRSASAQPENQQSQNTQLESGKSGDRETQTNREQSEEMLSPSRLTTSIRRSRSTNVPTGYSSTGNQGKTYELEQLKSRQSNVRKVQGEIFEKSPSPQERDHDASKIHEGQLRQSQDAFSRKRSRSPDSGDEKVENEMHQVSRRRQTKLE